MDQTKFKMLMAGVPAPVTVVTTRDGDIAHGATVSSLASLSLEPPMISIALITGSSLLGQIRSNGAFGVNLLSQSQVDIAMQFASRVDDRFAGVPWSWDHDLPRLSGISSFMQCTLESDVVAGDHAMLFGRIHSCHINDVPPLIYTARKFGTHSKLTSDRIRGLADVMGACARPA